MDPVLQFDPWYLAPPEESKDIQHTEYYIKHGEKKNIRRKIFETVPYDEFEKKCLVEFKEFVQQNKVQVPPTFKESTYLKMLQSGKYNMKKSLKALTQHVEWINNPKWHNLNTFSTDFLKQGNVYLCGRDKQMRPVIYMDCQHLNLKVQGAENITQAICVFLEMIKNRMMVGGKIENWIFIIDTREKGIFDLPLKALGVIIDVMQVNFGGHLEKLFILNPSFGLSTTWSVIEKMIDEEAAAKIKFLKKSKLNQLQEFIDPKYLQKKYTGQLENFTEFWPPVDIYSTQQQREERIRKENAAKQAVVVVEPVKEIAIQGTLLIQKEQENNITQAQAFSFTGFAEPIQSTTNATSTGVAPNVVVSDKQEYQQAQPYQQQQQQQQQVESYPQNQSSMQFGAGAGSPKQEFPKKVGDQSNKAEDQMKMSQSFGNTNFYQLTKQPSKRQADQNQQQLPPNQQNNLSDSQTKLFELETEKVENRLYRPNQKAAKQDELNNGQINNTQTTEKTAATTIQSNNVNQNQKEESQQPKEDQFKEVEKGFVIMQEEEEEGQSITAEDVNQLIKKSKSVFAKQSTTVKEDKKMVEIEEIDRTQQNQGGCCSNSQCNIF